MFPVKFWSGYADNSANWAIWGLSSLLKNPTRINVDLRFAHSRMGNSQLKIEIYDWFGQCNDIEHVTWRVLDNDATLIGYL